MRADVFDPRGPSFWFLATALVGVGGLVVICPCLPEMTVNVLFLVALLVCLLLLLVSKYLGWLCRVTEEVFMVSSDPSVRVH